MTRGEDDAYFEQIMDALVDKKYVTAWPVTKLGPGAAPVLQNMFRYEYEEAALLEDK